VRMPDAYNIGPGARWASKYCLLLSVVQVALHPKRLAAWEWCVFLWSVRIFVHHLPEFARAIPVEIYGAPIFFLEMTMGFWLLFKDYDLPELHMLD